jgi:hypothetical protein
MERGAALRAAAIGALALLAAAACGGGGDKDAGPPATLPACAGNGPPIERPAELPADFPLPPGAVLRRKEKPFPGQVVIRGAVPGDLDGAGAFFEGELEDAGYRVGRNDAEPGEREALFTRGPLRGGWRVNSIPDCAAVSLTLVVIRQP